MKIAIIGMGYVGKVTAEILKQSHDIVMYDKYLENDYVIISPGNKHLGYLQDKDVVNTCDMAFVCVSTPEGEDGKCDLSAIEDVMDWLKTPINVIRSTVPPGTCERFNVVHWPEFYGEWPTPILHGNPWEDNTLLGGSDWEEVADVLKVCYPSKHKFIGYDSARVTEITKLAENTFLATKIELSNILFDMCGALNISWENVRNAWTSDPRIGADHTTVRPDGRGFKGKCLPKDVASLLATAKKYNVSADMIEALIKSNKQRIE